MKLKLLIPIAVAGMLLAFGATTQAGLYTGLNLADYNAYEVSSTQNLLPGTDLSGIVIVHDVWRQDGTGTSIAGTDNSSPAITGVFDITAKYILDGSGNQLHESGGVLVDASNNPYTGTAYALFAPTGASGLLGTGGTNAPAGAMLELYNNSANPLTQTSLAATITSAESGSLLGTFGLGLNDTSSPAAWGEAGNGYWYAQLTYGPSASSPATPAGVSESLANAVFYGFGLQKLAGPIQINNQVYNDKIGATGLGIPPTTLIGNNQSNGPAVLFPSVTNPSPTPFDITGGGQSFSGGPSYLPIKGDDPVHVDVAPEPTTVVIWGLGAAFLGIAGRFRRRK